MAEIVEALSTVAVPLTRFVEAHYHRRDSGCACLFCAECPHVMDMLHIVQEFLVMRMRYLDQAQPRTVTECAELLWFQESEAVEEPPVVVTLPVSRPHPPR